MFYTSTPKVRYDCNYFCKYNPILIIYKFYNINELNFLNTYSLEFHPLLQFVFLRKDDHKWI